MLEVIQKVEKKIDHTIMQLKLLGLLFVIIALLILIVPQFLQILVAISMILLAYQVFYLAYRINTIRIHIKEKVEKIHI